MGEEQWYYMDAQRQRRGPVTAAEVAAAYGSGELSASGLVWHAGMAEWRPFSACRAEFGHPGGPVPPLAGPYAPPQSTGVREPAGINRSDVVPAGFMRRWAALILDSLILYAVMFVLAGALFLATNQLAHAGPPIRPSRLVLYPVWYLAAMLYYALQESSVRQATFGKRALGIKVADQDGAQISFGRAVARWFASALSYLTLYIGFLMAAFTDRKRALHDMVAGTLVVDRWAYTEHPEQQKRGGSVAAALLVVFVGAVPVVAILAAIAVPAYQDYTLRSQVSEGAQIAEGAKIAIVEYYSYKRSFPVDNAEAGLPPGSELHGSYVTRLDIRDGTILLTYGNKASPLIAGRVLGFMPHPYPTSVRWTCDRASGTTIDDKFLPKLCR